MQFFFHPSIFGGMCIAFNLQNMQDLRIRVGCSCLHLQYLEVTNEMRSPQLVAGTVNCAPSALPPVLASCRRQTANKAGRLACSRAAGVESWGWVLYAGAIIREGIYLLFLMSVKRTCALFQLTH